jgi:hypothetical protein
MDILDGDYCKKYNVINYAIADGKQIIYILFSGGYELFYKYKQLEWTDSFYNEIDNEIMNFFFD